MKSCVFAFPSLTALVLILASGPAAAQGQALVTLPNGDRASAPVTGQGLDGPGTYVFSDGLRVYGFYHHGLMRGPVRVGDGSTIYPGTISRQGVFYSFSGPVDRDWRPNGWGISRYPAGDTLRGRWVHGRMTGRFTDLLHDGSKINVSIARPSDELRGPATVSLPNGDKELGRMDRSALSGPGVYIDAFTGNRISGVFVHGALEGPATLLTPEGETFSGVEKGGVFYQ